MANMMNVKKLIRSARIRFLQPEYKYTATQGWALTTGTDRKKTIEKNRRDALKLMKKGLEEFEELRSTSKLKLLSTDDIVTAAVIASHVSGPSNDGLLPNSLLMEEPIR